MTLEPGMVAVVTGAASGIGQAIAGEFFRRGLRVVLVDIDAHAIEATHQSWGGESGRSAAVCADLSNDRCVQQLRQEIEQAVGSPDVLCNCAGVYAASGTIWETQPADWQWVWQVNVMGLVRTLRALVPGMLRRGSSAHIVNTSSIMGFASGASSSYSTSKHAVARITEGLYHDLMAAGAPIGVSLLSPGLVATQLMRSNRNRPDDLRGTPPSVEEMEERETAHSYFQTHGRLPSLVAAAAVQAIERNRFFVFPGADPVPHLEARLACIREGRAPTLVPLTLGQGRFW